MNFDITSRRLLPLYLSAFFQMAVFWYAIERVFMQSIGFDDASTGVMLAIMVLGSFLFEIPSGVLADRWSRKGVILIALAALLISTIGGGFSQDIAAYNFFLFFWGIYTAMISGTKEAMIYDLLLETEGNADNYTKYFSRHEILQGVGYTFGALVSIPIVYFSSLQMTYYLTNISIALSILCILFFKEPKEHRKKSHPKMLPHLRATFSEIFLQPKLYLLIFSQICVAVTIRIIFGYAQLWWIPLGLSLTLFGFLSALVDAATWIGGFVASKIQSTGIAIVCACTITASALLTIKNLFLVSFAITCVMAAMFALTIFLSKRLNDSLSSEVRAGAASAVGFTSNFFSIGILILFGYVSDKHTISNASWIVVCLATAIAVGAILVMKKDFTGMQKVIDLVSLDERERIQKLLSRITLIPLYRKSRNLLTSQKLPRTMSVNRFSAESLTLRTAKSCVQTPRAER